MDQQTAVITEKLMVAYPDAACELHFSTPLELLIATCLSAQTTDRQVNKVTENLFAVCRSLDDYLALSVEDIEGYIHSLGFYHNKAQHLYLMFRQLAHDYGGEVPQSREALMQLTGVGRKTANVVMANAFGQQTIAVDTHVFRVANRIGLSHAKTPEQTEQQLMERIDVSLWTKMHHVLIFHGRRCCSARKPSCGRCPVQAECEAFGEQGRRTS